MSTNRVGVPGDRFERLRSLLPTPAHPTPPGVQPGVFMGEIQCTAGGSGGAYGAGDRPHAWGDSNARNAGWVGGGGWGAGCPRLLRAAPWCVGLEKDWGVRGGIVLKGEEGQGVIR